MVVAPLMRVRGSAGAERADSWMISVTGSVFAAWMALAVAGEVARGVVVTMCRRVRAAAGHRAAH
jgi:hypothetical protein